MAKTDEKLSVEDVAAIEPDLLAGLLDDAEHSEPVRVRIVRGERVLGSFSIRPLRESEVNACREDATKYETNRMGIRIPKDMDTTRYRSLLIHTATVDEDRKRLWGDGKLWQKFGVTNGADLIDRLLYAGEKDAIIDKITEISNFGMADKLVELGKS